jgi:hypothetical protein
MMPGQCVACERLNSIRIVRRYLTTSLSDTNTEALVLAAKSIHARFSSRSAVDADDLILEELMDTKDAKNESETSDVEMSITTDSGVDGDDGDDDDGDDDDGNDDDGDDGDGNDDNSNSEDREDSEDSEASNGDKH